MNASSFSGIRNSGLIILGFLGISSLSELLAQAPGQPAAPQPATPPVQTAAPIPAQSPGETWERRRAGEVSLEAPFPLEEGPDVFERAPIKLRETLASVKTFKAGGEKEGFQISITNIVYKPGVPVNIDEAIRGITERITAYIGDPTHQFNTQPTKVSDLEARHAEFHGATSAGRPFYASMVVVQLGQKLWEVQAVSTNEAVVNELARVVGSLVIEPTP